VATVLRPIGESLRLITEGGRFINYDNDSSSLTVRFNLNVVVISSTDTHFYIL